MDSPNCQSRRCLPDKWGATDKPNKPVRGAVCINAFELIARRRINDGQLHHMFTQEPLLRADLATGFAVSPQVARDTTPHSARDVTLAKSRINFRCSSRGKFGEPQGFRIAFHSCSAIQCPASPAMKTLPATRHGVGRGRILAGPRSLAAAPIKIAAQSSRSAEIGCSPNREKRGNRKLDKMRVRVRRLRQRSPPSTRFVAKLANCDTEHP